jgi:hypothetical protein
MYSVEMRVDVGGADGIPHTFIVVTGPDGVERGYGFAPRDPGALAGDGKIWDNTGHEYSQTTGKIPLDPDSYMRLMDYIQKSTENPPPYYLPYGSQCATWAFKALTEAGIPALASPNMFPDDFLRDLFETIIWNPYTQWLNLTLRDLFTRAKRWTRPRDPIILDLDGDGLETVGVASNIYFDFDADGVLTRTGWVNKDDALLVWDRNGNGRIDTGAELFGDFTPLPNGTLAPNGFAALAALDSNGDGVIDASDPAFAELKLWRDTSQDGVSHRRTHYPGRRRYCQPQPRPHPQEPDARQRQPAHPRRQLHPRRWNDGRHGRIPPGHRHLRHAVCQAIEVPEPSRPFPTWAARAMCASSNKPRPCPRNWLGCSPSSSPPHPRRAEGAARSAHHRLGRHLRHGQEPGRARGGPIPHPIRGLRQ